MRFQVMAFVLGSLVAWGAGSVSAQMITSQMPLQHQGASFFEQSNIGWSVHNPHYFMTFNGGGAAPPFGGYQPNAGLQGGFAVGNSHFNFGFAQGASYSSTTVVPMLTTTNGYPGAIFIGSSRPFVTGVSPLVGGVGFGNVPPMGPLENRIATGQLRVDHGRIMVPGLDAAGIPPAPMPANGGNVRADQAVAIHGGSTPAAGPSSRDLTATQYLERGVAAEQDGKQGVAKIYYQLAAAKGDALINAEATARLERLKAAAGK